MMTKPRYIAFLIDPPETFNIESDTTIFLMRAAAERGYEVAYFTLADLFYENGAVKASVKIITLHKTLTPWFTVQKTQLQALEDCAAVIIRKDPPFDQEYLYATYLLERLQQTLVSNHPRSIRDCNEKIFATHFSEWMVPTLISADTNRILDFLATHQQIVLKALNAMGGKDVLFVDQKNVGNNALIILMTQHNTRCIMAQQFIPEVHQGDKRIFLIDGIPMPQALLRQPAAGDFRANLSAGGQGRVTSLSEREHHLCALLKPVLQQKQLDFVGIDVIHGFLTEINVTSPTGLRRVFAETGINLAENWMDRIDAHLKTR